MAETTDAPRERRRAEPDDETRRSRRAIVWALIALARRWLAPHLRDHPAAAYVVVAALFLLWLAFIPGIANFGQVLVILLLAVLAAVGVEALRRQTAREFPK
jgi:hypothetical protein